MLEVWGLGDSRHPDSSHRVRVRRLAEWTTRTCSRHPWQTWRLPSKPRSLCHLSRSLRLARVFMARAVSPRDSNSTMYTMHHVHSLSAIAGLVDTSRAQRSREAHCQERAWNHLVMRLLAGPPLAYAGTMCNHNSPLALPTLLEQPQLLRHFGHLWFLANCVAHRVASQAWSTLDALFHRVVHSVV